MVALSVPGDEGKSSIECNPGSMSIYEIKGQIMQRNSAVFVKGGAETIQNDGKF